VSYGFGYTGIGFSGGVWAGGVFTYNRAVTNVGASVSVTNVYNKTVIVNNTTNVSFNGGTGGIQAQASAQELAAANEHHIGPTNEQLQHHQLAAKNPDLKFKHNQGKPAIAATSKAGDFSKGHTFAAKSGGSVPKPASQKAKNAPGSSKHAEGGGPRPHPGSRPPAKQPAHHNEKPH
jgi:hypothetical protein